MAEWEEIGFKNIYGEIAGYFRPVCVVRTVVSKADSPNSVNMSVLAADPKKGAAPW